MSQPAFLATPQDIRRAVGLLAPTPGQLDLAVAFVGRDRRDAIADFGGSLRVVCWLSSTNTDPRAVRQMIARRRTVVRQRDGMHAKVYVAPGRGAVVGSANLSRRALAEDADGLQDEAGVLLTDPKSDRAIATWFDRLWNAKSTRKITQNDLKRAIVAFDKARANKGSRGDHSKKPRTIDDLAATNRKRLQRLAEEARRIDLAEAEYRWLAGIVPERVTRNRLVEIVDEFADWMGRRFLFERALLDHPISRVRRALAVLFDEGRDVDNRLSTVVASGDLAPLRVSTLSVLLYWRAPHKYPPFNRRTKRFLADFRLLERGASSASPESYVRWLAQAEQLSQTLNLPTPGHVDRMAWAYTQDMTL